MRRGKGLALNPYAPLPVCDMTLPSPKANMKRTRYSTFTLDFKRAILMLGEKMTLVQFFGNIALNNGRI